MTKEQIKAGLEVIQTIAETIRELKTVPSGVLYAGLMGKLELNEYQRIIQILKDADLVRETAGHVLEWKG